MTIFQLFQRTIYPLLRDSSEIVMLMQWLEITLPVVIGCKKMAHTIVEWGGVGRIAL